MAIEVLWLQANPGDEALVAATSARQNRQLIDVLLAEGVVDVDGGDLACTEHADEWKVTVAAGRAVITGDDQASQGKYLVTVTTAEDVALNPPPGSDSRIDVVYLQVNDPNAGGDDGYTATLSFVEGVVDAAPVAPSVPDSAIALCSVLRETADATWADASITDLREATTLALQAADSGTSLPVVESATIATSQATTSTSYTDLGTVGPSVTVEMDEAGDVLVVVTGQAYNSTGSGGGIEHMSFAVTGATTIAAADAQSLRFAADANFYPDMLISAVFRVTLNAGSNVVTAKYRVLADQGTFLNRSIHVMPVS